MSATQARDQAPPQELPVAVPPTPIWISHRLQILLVIGAIALLLLAMWLVPGILTIVLGGVGLALVLSHPVGWLCRLMPGDWPFLWPCSFCLGASASPSQCSSPY